MLPAVTLVLRKGRAHCLSRLRSDNMKFFALFFAIFALLAVFASASPAGTDSCAGKCNCAKAATNLFCAKDSKSQNKLPFENNCKMDCHNCQRGTTFTLLHDGSCH